MEGVISKTAGYSRRGNRQVGQAGLLKGITHSQAISRAMGTHIKINHERGRHEKQICQWYQETGRKEVIAIQEKRAWDLDKGINSLLWESKTKK